MKETPLYRELLATMTTYSDPDFAADLERFIDSFADHDPDCPVVDVGSRRELESCTCGFARRFDFYDQLRIRLGREVRGDAT